MQITLRAAPGTNATFLRIAAGRRGGPPPPLDKRLEQPRQTNKSYRQQHSFKQEQHPDPE